MEKIGERLKILRKQKKLTAEKLAELVGIDRTYISKIENTYFIPSFKILYKIAEKLDDYSFFQDALKEKYPELKQFLRKQTK